MNEGRKLHTRTHTHTLIYNTNTHTLLQVSWICTSVGQALAFLVGRYLFRPTVKVILHTFNLPILT